MLRTITKLAILASACALPCASLPGAARAANCTWAVTGGAGNWFAAGNWNPSGPPTSNYNAYVVNGGTAVITQSGAACSMLNIGGTNTGWVQINGGGLADTYLQLGTVNNGATGAGVLALSSGTLNTAIWEYIGLTGNGTFMQSGGTNTAVTLDFAAGRGASGTYNLSSGLLIATSNEYVGVVGTGNFTQSGGTNTTANLEFGYGADVGSGTYSLDGGVLNISALTVASNNNATFDAGGGTLQAAQGFATSALMMLTGSNGDAYFNSNGNTLTLHGALSGSGGLQKMGAGMLVLTASNTYLGNTTVSAGTLQVSSGQLPGNLEYVGGSGAALAVSGGSNVVATGLDVGNNAGESGSYSLGTGGQLSSAGWETVGNFGTGLFTQSGGRNSVSTALSVGNGAGSYGAYYMQGGTLTANQESIGVMGTGLFTQSGGSNSVSTALYVGIGSGPYGAYNMQAGTLAANQESIGHTGTGTFTQSSGSNSVSTTLYVGNGSGSYGTYNMQGGTLAANQESIGLTGTGTFTQTGGTHTVIGSFVLAKNLFSEGTYNLDGGTLSCQQIAGGAGISMLNLDGGKLVAAPGANSNFISGLSALTVGNTATASYTQSSGSNNVGVLYLGFNASASGSFQLETADQASGGNGNLNGSGVLNATSEFIGTSGSGSFTHSGGTNMSSALVVGMEAGASGSYNLSGAGVLICNSHYSDYESIGYQGSGNFVQSGGTNNTNILYIGAGLGGTGTYSLNGGTLTCQQIQGGEGTGTLILDGGLLLAASGANSNFISGLTTLTVGNSATASYTQPFGSINVGNLNLGFNAGGSGSYNLSGSAVLNVGGSENLGYSGSGSFTQSGGQNNAASLQLGQMASGTGTYSLNGGTLTCQQIQGGAGTSTLIIDGGVLLPAAGASNNFISGLGTLTVGNWASASYTQSSGSNYVGNLYLGLNPGASGSYNLNGSAVLSVSGSESVGCSGSGSFTQSGGINTAAFLQVGQMAGASGSYNLNGSAVLSVSGSENVGYSGSGSFTQSGGINTAGFLQLGQMASGNGSYNLNGAAVLSVSGYENVGYSGSGSFTQSGGANFAGFLQLGQTAGGSGTYNLNGGLLSCERVRGGAGTSTLNFNGGVLQAAAGAKSNFVSDLTAVYVMYRGATIDTNGQSVTINQPLLDGGGGGMSVVGGGTLILTNSNTYAGGTTLNDAWLVASNGTQGSATGNGPVTVYSGGLAGRGGGTITGPVLLGVGAPSVIQPGIVDPGSTTLNLLGGLIIYNGSELYYTLDLSSSIAAGLNGLPVYGGDLINLGGSNLYVVNGSVAFASNPILPGDYRLIANVSNSNSVDFAKLAPPTVTGEIFAWSTTADPGFIDLVASGILGLNGGTWVSPVSGSWGTPTNWSCNPGIPIGGTVVFSGTVPGLTVTLDADQTAGALLFNFPVNNVPAYTLSQGTYGTLTLGTSAGGSITVLGGSHSILAPIAMAGNLTVSVTGGASLGMSGLLSETATGTSVTFTGPGLTTFGGTSTITGNTNVYGGTLQINPGAQCSNSFDWQVGGTAGASVIQQGGNNSLANRLCVGLSPTMTGTYTLQAGTLNTTESDVGYYGPGVFVQNGGVHSTQLIVLGSSGATTCSGTYNLSAGSLCANVESIPLGGIGVFNQTGGTNTIGVGMTLGGGGAPAQRVGGSYNLNGGLLTTSSLSMGGAMRPSTPAAERSRPGQALPPARP